MFSTVQEVGLDVCRLIKVFPGHTVRATLQSRHCQIVTSHWFGRQLACPGEECPACGTYPVRVSCFFLATAWTGKVWTPGLFEVCPGEFARLRFMCGWEKESVEAGTCVVMSRKGARSSVRCEPSLEVGGPIIPALGNSEVLLSSVARLLGLPGLRPGELFTAWCERVRPGLVLRLEAAIRQVEGC